ncbi:unannotated protein [freshwater metagenome]|uniref:Unannotated protein n=1 Tax=freshwater metagenome TaxID=449393 RepID=A0A6J7DJJ3_9ZZZZ
MGATASNPAPSGTDVMHVVDGRSAPLEVKLRSVRELFLIEAQRVAHLQRDLQTSRAEALYKDTLLSEAADYVRGVAPFQPLQYVFVVTYGRSGSTLMQGVLNSIDGVLCRGENADLLRGLRDSVASLKYSQGMAPTNPEHPWFGAESLSLSTYLSDLRGAVVRQLLGDRSPDGLRYLGFKEIRYFEHLEHDLEDYLEFVTDLFPGARFIHHTREHSAVAKSEWWREFETEALLSQLKEFDDRVRAFCEKRSADHVLATSYERLLADPEETYRSVGALFGLDVEAKRIHEVLSREHSYRTSTQR